MNQIRQFINIQYVYNDIEFVDLPSIFKDKFVVSSIPA